MTPQGSAELSHRLTKYIALGGSNLSAPLPALLSVDNLSKIYFSLQLESLKPLIRPVSRLPRYILIRLHSGFPVYPIKCNAIHRTVACSQHQFQGNREVCQESDILIPHTSPELKPHTSLLVATLSITFNQPCFPKRSLNLHKTSFPYH